MIIEKLNLIIKEKHKEFFLNSCTDLFMNFFFIKTSLFGQSCIIPRKVMLYLDICLLYP